MRPEPQQLPHTPMIVTSNFEVKGRPTEMGSPEFRNQTAFISALKKHEFLDIYVGHLIYS